MEAANNDGHEKENRKNCEKYCNNTGFLGEEEDDDEKEILKRKISTHPLYGRLIETHLNCLKMGLGEGAGEVGTTTDMSYDLNHARLNLKPNIPTSDELDRFMNAYCITLKKLKEAMEEPVKETTMFIHEMHIQLRELCESARETNPIQSKSNSSNH